MLTWQRDECGWRGNGFRIELTSPETWVLFEVDADAAQSEDLKVFVDPVPLASASTLATCKLTAEALHASRRRFRQRRALALLLVATVFLSVLNSLEPILEVTLLVLAGGAALELIMTWWELWRGDPREIIQ